MWRKEKRLHHSKLLILGSSLLALVSCGNYDDDDYSQGPQQEELQTGTFQARLTPLNSNVSGLINGTAEIVFEGDTFEARTNVIDAPDSTHPQYIYLGSTCPDPSADSNQDSFIDGIEVQSTAGKIIIPLDDDLATQSSGSFPIGVSYQYNESTSFLEMVSELKMPDDDATDSVTRLGQNDEIDLDGRVVIIHGVPASATLPMTVRGVDGATAQETLPIACGVLVRKP